jgi:microcystin degradation protein MlrC
MEKRVRLANVSVLFKEYPHVDFMERGEEVVEMVLQTLRGKIKPVSSLYDPRMWDFYPTTTEPMRSFVDRVTAMEGKNGVLSISIGHGFSHADVPDMGSRVLVITDDRKADGDKLAQALGDEMFVMRGKWCPPSLSLDGAITQALAHNRGTAIVAEPSDNAGGGAASDNTLTIHELIRRNASSAAVAPVWDPVAVEFCVSAGVGAKIPLRFGGKASAESGPPVDAEVEVIGIAKNSWQHLGAAKIPLGGKGIDVILITKRTQALGAELFTHLGLDPGSYKVLVLKSAQHFAGAYGPYASLIVRADTGGCCAQDPRGHVYKRVKRPLWPLDDKVEGRMIV